MASSANRSQEMQLLGMAAVPRLGGVGQKPPSSPLLSKSQSLQTINELGRAPICNMDLVPRRRASAADASSGAAGALQAERRRPDLSPTLRRTSIAHQASRRHGHSPTPSPRAFNLCSHLTSVTRDVKTIGRKPAERRRSPQRVILDDLISELRSDATISAGSSRRASSAGTCSTQRSRIFGSNAHVACKEERECSDDDVSTQVTSSGSGSSRETPAVSPYMWTRGIRDDEGTGDVHEEDDVILAQSMARLFEAKMQELLTVDKDRDVRDVSRRSSVSSNSNCGTSAASFSSCRQVVLSPRLGVRHLTTWGGC